LTTGNAPGDLLLVGRVARAHGLRGELRIEPFNVDSDSLARVEQLWLSPDAEQAAVASRCDIDWLRPVPKAFLVKLQGVDDRNAAEALRGQAVWVARGELPETDSGEYFLVDLIGATVRGPDGDVGIVVEVATHPSVDALVIRTPEGGTLEQPLVDDYVQRVSVAEKLVELSSLEGLIG
jgi:16S rRNA processing protein RimM